MTGNAYFVGARSVQEIALLIQIQITSCLGHVLLRRLLGEVRTLPVPHLSQQGAAFLSANPLRAWRQPCISSGEALSHLALFPGFVPRVVETCGSFSLSQLSLDSFLLIHTAHSLPWRGRVCCSLTLNLVCDTFKQWSWAE